MKERIIQLLDLEQLTPSKFADIIGVQRSSVSHVISERNKPSFDFIQKTLKAFPGLNAEWLILGEGSMYEQMGRTVSGNLFESQVEPVQTKTPGRISEEHTVSNNLGDSAGTPEEPEVEKTTEQGNEPFGMSPTDQSQVPAGAETAEQETLQTTGKKIVQVMLFYDDDTFRSFGPSQ
jgi:transcriptional regulator with XRE-family HTH domain